MIFLIMAKGDILSVQFWPVSYYIFAQTDPFGWWYTYGWQTWGVSSDHLNRHFYSSIFSEPKCYIWILCDGMLESFILLWMQDEEETSKDISEFPEFRIHRANLSSIFLSFNIETTTKSWWMIIQNVLHEKVCSVDLPLVVLWLRLV